MEVLSYHNTCSDTEVAHAKEEKIPDAIPGIEE
jgi:hypothetical protein